MGYQVGAACYTDKQLAENIYFSQVVPVITENGVKQIVYNGRDWYYGSQKIEARLPQCDPAANYKLGFEVGMALLPTALVLASAVVIIKLFSR